MTQEALMENATYINEKDNASGYQQPVVQGQTIRDSVASALENYFAHLDGQEVFDVYDMVLAEVEAPLLEAVMKYTRKNQTKASAILGLNRGTLRKKLKQYDML